LINNPIARAGKWRERNHAGIMNDAERFIFGARVFALINAIALFMPQSISNRGKNEASSGRSSKR
jgi:hypothetical protein